MLNLCNLFKTSLVNTVNSVRHFTRYKKFVLGQINHPPKIYNTDDKMGGDEMTAWKENRSLLKIHKRGPLPDKSRRRSPIDNSPQMRGIILKMLTKKPRKPNSANRRCCLLKLSNGKEKIAYCGKITNLQEHSSVLVRLHKVQDVVGVRLRVIPYVYDASGPIPKK